MNPVRHCGISDGAKKKRNYLGRGGINMSRELKMSNGVKKKLMIGMFVLLFIFIGSFLAVDSWSSVVSRAPEEVKEAFKSVVEVRATAIWRGGLEIKGEVSGFFVAPDYVLTVPHIVSQFSQVIEDPRTKIEIEVGGKIFPAQLVAIDWRKELMLLKVRDAPFVPVVKFASDVDVEEDDTVFITGYISKPLENKRKRYISAPTLIESIDEKKKTRKGSLSGMAMAKYGVSKLLTIYGKTGEGVSGGPVFNINGEVVGLSWLMMDDYVFATPVDVIKEFLEEHLKEDSKE